MKRRGLAAGAVVLVGLGLWLSLHFAEADPGDTPGGEAAGSPLPVAGAAEGRAEQNATGAVSENEPELGRRLSEGQKPVLLLDVRDKDGQPQTGRVYARFSSTPPATADLLSPEYGYSLSPDVQLITYKDGRCEIPVPEGAWTWLRVTGPGAVPISRYLRLAPFDGQQRQSVVLDNEARGLHAFVLKEDLSSPAPQCQVALYRNDIRSPGPLARVAVRSTDEHGYCSFDGVAPGAYLLAAGDAKPSDTPPWTQRLILPPGSSISEVPCTLVAPPHRYRMSIDVRASIAKRAGRDVLPRVYFVPLSGRGELVVSPITLKDGMQEFDVLLREGLYECRVLPIGDLRVDSTTLSVTEDGPRKHSLFVADSNTQTQVVLKGIPRTEFPVHVRPRALNAVIHGSEDEMFTGPWSWSRSTETVRSTAAEPVTLVVSKRHRFWLSSQAVPLSGGSVTADLVPAARIHIEIPLDVDRAERRTGYATVRFAGQSLWVALRRTLVSKNGQMRPLLVGAAVVPSAPVHIVGFDGETSEQLWERTVEPKRARETITIGT